MSVQFSLSRYSATGVQQCGYSRLYSERSIGNNKFGNTSTPPLSRLRRSSEQQDSNMTDWPACLDCP